MYVKIGIRVYYSLFPCFVQVHEVQKMRSVVTALAISY